MWVKEGRRLVDGQPGALGCMNYMAGHVEAAETLGLTPAEANDLFVSDPYAWYDGKGQWKNADKDATTAEAVTVLREYAATGKIRWPAR